MDNQISVYGKSPSCDKLVDMYKTISFPKAESGTEKIERLRISIPQNKDYGFIGWVDKLSSKELRYLLIDSYRTLNSKAHENDLHLSELAINELKSHYQKLLLITGSKKTEQIDLFANTSEDKLLGRHGTFMPNRVESIHRWYPYVEGFSSTFVESIIEKWSAGAEAIYDPFAGTGTAMTVASINGIKGYYSEVNPFMRLVIDAKTNILKELSSKQKLLRDYLYSTLDDAQHLKLSQEAAEQRLTDAFPGRPYFIGNRLIEIVALKDAVHNSNPKNHNFKSIALMALGSIGVPSSETKRSSDLRYRTPKELLKSEYSAFDAYEKKISQIIDDIHPDLGQMTESIFASENAVKVNDHPNSVDLVVTSPPYLNGTNYFRNTKLELWLAGFINHEKDLGYFTREAMIAGINNVSKTSRDIKRFDFVEPVAKELDEVAYDSRIPTLIRGYCSDTELWLKSCKVMMKPNARMVIDIGDSRFAGVHVPTDEYIIKIANGLGLNLIDTELVRKRTSNDGTPLKQVLLAFENSSTSKKRSISQSASGHRVREHFKDQALAFEKLPYKSEPYNSRNWGHPLHSLCSYQGKLKPAIAHFLVEYFTEVGDTVLDPLSGAGTIPLEAFLSGRKAIANDLQELGFILSSAKIAKPSNDKVIKELDKIIKYVNDNKQKINLEKNQDKDFGLNGKIYEYFDEENLKEIIAAREYIAANKCNTVERAIVYSSFLHILHGNRPYALSRNSHPVTPFKPTGEFEYRNLEERLYAKVSRALKAYEGAETINGEAFMGSYDTLQLKNEVDTIITSPPFAASTRFYVANWMRLWMAGWKPDDFKSKKFDFLEEKQKKNLDIYADFFEHAHKWLKPDGKLILHLGKTKKFDMAQELSEICSPFFDVIHSFDEDVAGREKFGIKDQGATVAHQYLFLIRKQTAF